MAIPSNQTALIILNWNRRADTLACLDSIYSRHRQPDFTVYVVDNASTDGSPQAIKARYPQAIQLLNSKNLGFAAGNNVGLKRALQDRHRYLILLNNDTTVSKNFVPDFISAYKQSKFDIVSPKIYFYPGREFHHHSYLASERGRIIWYAGGHMDWANVIPSHIGVNEYDHGQFDQPQPTDFTTGCCMLIPSRVIRQIGFFDETYHMYFEDNDYCQRALRRSFTLGYLPGAHLWHKNAGSTGGSGSRRQTKLVDHSRFKFGLRYAPLRAKLALIKQKLLSR